jgi:hypothetical protein
VKKISDTYYVIVNYHLDDSLKTAIYLDDNSKRCRFCGNSYPKVSFNNEAHTIPEFTGNKMLFSNYECDNCNMKFSRLETQMANLMHLSHVIFSVPGKKGSVKYVESNSVQISSNGHHIKFNQIDDKNLNYDNELRKIEIKQRMPTYTPIAVYKCLTKMALTIMPKEELPFFERTLDWINNKKHNSIKFDGLWLIYTTFSSRFRFPYVSTILCKKVDSSNLELPYMIFRLAYANFSFQIFLPLCSLDNRISFDTHQLPYIPHLIDLVNGFEYSKREFIDFSSWEKNSNSITFEIENLDK